MIRRRRDCGSLEANSVIIKATEVTKPLQRHCLCLGTRWNCNALSSIFSVSSLFHGTCNSGEFTVSSGSGFLSDL